MSVQQGGKEAVITRINHPPEGGAPWEGVKFIPGLDTDQLFEKLKNLYPGLESHKQRKLQAVIDFFTAELRAEVAQPGTQSNDSDYATATESERSNSHSASPNLSPTSPNFPSNHGGKSSGRKTGASLPRPHPGHTPLQINVFKASDGEAVRQKERRKMSDEEKMDYKIKRAKGACDQCRKSKKKCNCDKTSASIAKLPGAAAPAPPPKRKPSKAFESNQPRPSKVLKKEEPSEIPIFPNPPGPIMPINMAKGTASPPNPHLHPPYNLSPVQGGGMWTNNDGQITGGQTSEFGYVPSETRKSPVFVPNPPGSQPNARSPGGLQVPLEDPMEFTMPGFDTGLMHDYIDPSYIHASSTSRDNFPNSFSTGHSHSTVYPMDPVTYHGQYHNTQGND